ncbi:MAG: HutD family protein [Granulosicoccaceae bacterium]
MTLQHIPFEQFEAKPWKNGLGTTYDIALLPNGADHTSFDLRFALSPIVEDNVFSAFPGIERVITPVEGEGLGLEFDDAKTQLSLYQSFRFDSALTPMGKPVSGPIKVINAMARRDSWNILSCDVTERVEHEISDGEILFLFVLGCCSVHTGEEQALINKHGAVLVTGATRVSISSVAGTRVLCAHLQPV